jgi:hypothetical protein
MVRLENRQSEQVAHEEARVKRGTDNQQTSTSKKEKYQIDGNECTLANILATIQTDVSESYVPLSNPCRVSKRNNR